jgi:hypothetical protein
VVQAVSRRPLIAEILVRAQFSPCGIYSGQTGTGTDFSPSFFVISLSVSFYHVSPYSYIIWGMDNKLDGGRSSETSSRPIDMNSSNHFT